MFENKVVLILFGPKRQGVRRGMRKLHMLVW